MGYIKFIVLLIFVINNCSGLSLDTELQILDNLLLSYDARRRPYGFNNTDPVEININMFIRSIPYIDGKSMPPTLGPVLIDVPYLNLIFEEFLNCKIECAETNIGLCALKVAVEELFRDKVETYDAELTFRQQWVDKRLQFEHYVDKPLYLSLHNPQAIWVPDVFVSNAREAHFHDVFVPNNYIRIFPSGSVLYSTRVSLTLSCPMNLRAFPMDTQICPMKLASYSKSTNDLVFKWNEGNPVQVNKNFQLPNFQLDKIITDECTSKTGTGEYSCLKVDLQFKRLFTSYLLRIYIPCTMLVLVSWVAFWLNKEAVTARILLGAMTLFTLTFLVNAFNTSAPIVSYTKAVDVWTGVCMTFVFLTILESATINYSGKKVKDVKSRKAQGTGEHGHSASVSQDNLDIPSNTDDQQTNGKKAPHEKFLQKFNSFFPIIYKRLDCVSRIIFPVMFLIFNCVYWITY